MKILTKISENKKNPLRVSLFTEEGFLLSISKELAIRRGLRKGDAIEETLLKELAAEDDVHKAREAAYQMLERSRKTEKQVVDRLILKDYNDDVIEKVVKSLKEYGLLDDPSYADAYLKEKLKSRGRRRAEQELLAKGVSKEILHESLKSEELALLENTSCLAAASKKHAQLLRRGEEGFALKGKLYQHLAGKGYDGETIRAAMKTLLDPESYDAW